MESLKDRLAALTLAAKSARPRAKKRTATHALRENFDDIEQALAAGVSHHDLLLALHEQGIELTLNGFRTALYRLREERQQQPEAVAPDLAGDSKEPATALGSDDAKPGVRLAPSYMAGAKKAAPTGLELEAIRNKQVDLNSFSSKLAKKEK